MEYQHYPEVVIKVVVILLQFSVAIHTDVMYIRVRQKLFKLNVICYLNEIFKILNKNCIVSNGTIFLFKIKCTSKSINDNA